MVRIYFSRNKYEKWSKLTNEQMEHLLRRFFWPDTFSVLAEALRVTPRTVKSKHKIINERILNDRKCRAELIAFLCPELELMQRILEGEDLSAGSRLWDDLHAWLFGEPEPKWPFKIPRPTNEDDEYILGPTIFWRTRTPLNSWRRTKRDELREHFFRALLIAGASRRADEASKDIRGQEATSQVYRQIYDETASQLGAMLIRRFARQPLGV
jgi:hypothetical protein